MYSLYNPLKQYAQVEYTSGKLTRKSYNAHRQRYNLMSQNLVHILTQILRPHEHYYTNFGLQQKSRSETYWVTTGSVTSEKSMERSDTIVG